MPPERLVVIGGDAAGMSAASQARKRRGADSLQVVAFERGHATSYSARGIPYWISGAVGSAKELIARSPQQHRANGIDVRTRTEVVAIDLAARTVHARDLDGRRMADLDIGGYRIPGSAVAAARGCLEVDDGGFVVEERAHHHRLSRAAGRCRHRRAAWRAGLRSVST